MGDFWGRLSSQPKKEVQHVAKAIAEALFPGHGSGFNMQLGLRRTLSHVFSYSGAILEHVFEPQPPGCGSKKRYPEWNPGKWKRKRQPVVPGGLTQLFSDPGKKREPFLGKTSFSGAATQKKEEEGCL